MSCVLLHTKVNYKAYLILMDTFSAGICFVSVKTDLSLCFLFYEITKFSIKVLLPSRSLLFLCLSIGLNAHCHTPTCLWWHFCFYSRQMLSASGKFSSLEIYLRYSGPQEEPWPFTSGQQQEISSQVFYQTSMSDSKGPHCSLLSW